MASITFTGQAQKIPQVNTVTPASVASTNTFSVTFGGTKVVTFTAATTAVSDVTAGLYALLAASTVPEISECSFVDNSTKLTITGPPDGTPFTQTSSAAGGTATNVTATTTAASGPYFANVAANYAGGSLPSTAGDDLLVSPTAGPIKYGLAMSAYQLSSITFPQGYNGNGEGFGLPPTNKNGYVEYRQRYWQIGATTLNYGSGAGQGNGQGWLDLGSGGCTGVISNTGQSINAGMAALNILCTGTNTFEVLQGSVDFGPLPSDAATLATVNNVNGTVHVGAGVTLTTINTDGGSSTIDCAATTVYCEAGQTTVNGSGAVTNVTAFRSGAVVYNSSGTVTNAALKYGGTIDTSQDIRTKIFTNTAFTAAGTLILSSNPITQTNKPTYTDCRQIAAT